MPSTSRILAYDTIKTLAIFLVVFYHVGGLDYGTVSPGELYLPNLNKFLSTFCAASVPLFFMVNGALILPRHLTLKQLLKKSAKLLLLYVFGKVFLQYLLCQQLFGIPHEMVHFWFLLTLASLYPISYLLDRYPRLKKIVLLGLLVCPFFTNFLGDISAFLFHSVELPRFAHSGLFTLYSLVYFYLGAQLRDKHISTSTSLILLIVGLLLANFEVIAMSTYTGQIYDSGNALFPTIGAGCMSMALFSFLSKREGNNTYLSSFILCIGRNTLGIFMLHVLVLLLIHSLLPSLYNGIPFPIKILILFFVILICIILSFSIKILIRFTFIRNGRIIK